MKKRIVLIPLFISLAMSNSFSQSVRFNRNSIKSDTIEKKIIDNAHLRVYYSLDYRPDPADIFKKKHAETFLQVGKNVSRYMDYNRFRADSVNDANVRKGATTASFIPALMSLTRKVGFKPNVVIGQPKGKVSFQRSVVLTEIYEYLVDMPKLEWSLSDADTLIRGHKCKKAACAYGGRQYTAWYAEDLGLPLGPYIFRGLPGLIFEIRDTQKHYVFRLNGIEEMAKRDPIYLWTGSKVTKTTREKVRKIHENFCANPVKALMNTGKTIKIPEEQLSNIKPLPYNPIELVQ